MTPGPFALDPWTLGAIAAMAAATFLTRAGGYLLFTAITPPRMLREALKYVPGALFVSYVVPGLASGGLPQWAGAVGTLLLMVLTRNLALSILGGTLIAWVVWATA